jgi:hypothetical protein
LSQPDGTSPVKLRILRVHVWTLATFLPLLVRIVPLQLLVRLLTPSRRLRIYAGVPTDQIVALVRHRLRKPWNMRRRRCLREGLVIYHILRLAGQPAIVHFGVYPPSTDPKRLHGHCWVTVDGTCVSTPPGQPSADLMTCGGEDPS